MNKKIRRILGLITFIFLFTLTNCQTEDLIIKNSYNSSKNAKVKNLTFKQFQNQKNAQKTIIELNRFKKNNINSKNLSAKETIINIDSTSINQIIENGITSYTFSIINDNNDINQFENLVIQTDSLEQTSVFLIKYIPESHYDINNPFVGTREITQLDSNVIINANNKTIVCLTVTTYINYYLCDEGVIESPETCDFQYTETFTDTTCETLSGGGGDTYTNTTFVINNLSTTTGGGSGGNTVITAPIPVNYKKLRQINFSNTLTLPQKNWLNNPNNLASQTAIYDYLETTLIDENGFELFNASEYSTETKDFVNQLINLLINEINIDNNALNFMLSAKEHDKINNDLDEGFLLLANQYMDIDTSALDPIVMNQVKIYFTVQCAVLRYNHPTWSNAKIYWEASKEIVHIALDGFGMIPVVGEIADLTNGVLYLVEGDGVNATLSFTATIPIAGWTATGVKYAFKIKTVATIGTKVKLTYNVINGVIDFGNRGQLRKVLGLAVGNSDQAHHLIPWSSRTKMAVQRAAKSGSAFHMNEALNGIAVAAWRNQPNHNIYNNVIDAKLDNFRDLNPNATPQECYDFITDLVQDIRTWVINNPNSHLNDIVLP